MGGVRACGDEKRTPVDDAWMDHHRLGDAAFLAPAHDAMGWGRASEDDAWGDSHWQGVAALAHADLLCCDDAVLHRDAKGEEETPDEQVCDPHAAVADMKLASISSALARRDHGSIH